MKKVYLLLSGICLLFVGLYFMSYPHDSVQSISVSEAKRLIDAKEAIVIDVREEHEYLSGHIENALLIPVDEIDEYSLDCLKGDMILVYCRSGRRSKKACRKLYDLGYNKVYDLGGINDWPYDIVK